MKIKYCVFSLCFLLSYFTNAQSFKILYEISKNSVETELEKLEKIPDPKLKEQLKQLILAKDYYELSVTNRISLYKKFDINKPKDFSPEQENPNVKVMVIENKSTGVYQDFKTGEYLCGEHFFGKDFYIKDKVTKFDWKLTNETKQIGHFNCKKATTSYQGIEIEAWYSSELPISLGPSVFNGLPGLIIELKKGNITYNAISVEKAENVTIQKPEPKGKTITIEEFEKIQKERL